MSKKVEQVKSVVDMEVDPMDCPFREFKDNELSPEYWGMGPVAFRAAQSLGKAIPKAQADQVWVDEQTQPLQRSARKRLDAWIRAEELALTLWEASVIVYEESNGGKMSVADTQLSYTRVLHVSSFCRRVLSLCFILENTEGFYVEHQWENFVFSMPTEGWQARYHIYSPGVKPGGGQQCRPGISKNGCYLVRLYYLGAWRCVWVSDQVPVDASGIPLLPFAPLCSQVIAKSGGKQASTNTLSPGVQLWPMLLCKALLKLAAPDMNSDEESDCFEDEPMDELDILHALTGSLNLTYTIKDGDSYWKLLTSEVQQFMWEDDDETFTSTAKSKTKKLPNKEPSVVKNRSMTSILIGDTRNFPPFALAGITPAFEMYLLVIMTRDLPLKKPLPEPEVPLWKHYRWIDWARSHGLYDDYACPRTKFVKVNGLLKLSHAPHLLDVQSTESIKFGFRQENERTTPIKATVKDVGHSAVTDQTMTAKMKEELREWVLFDVFSSVASNPPIRITKAAPKSPDILAPKYAPVYLQIDGPDENVLRLSLSVLHPRVLVNSGVPILDYVEPGYMILEVFEWFIDKEVPIAKAFIQTRGYGAVEVPFKPGRHYCRLWVHSKYAWQVMLLSDFNICAGNRDVIQLAAVRECTWASRFLMPLGVAFQNWLRVNKSSLALSTMDKDFYKSYQPDLDWDPAIVGYNKALLHWMFRQALQSLLRKKLNSSEFPPVCVVLRQFFCDPEFGLTKTPSSPRFPKRVIASCECDCMPEAEELDTSLYNNYELALESGPIVYSESTGQLINLAGEQFPAQICEFSSHKLSCGVLKSLRETLIRKHEAASVIQAHWRGARARNYLKNRVAITPDVLKILSDNVFGNLESLSALMNEFFDMFPGAKYAYSVSSALTGTYGVKQFLGASNVTKKCKWIPYFKGVFFCHAPVKVHIDLQGTLNGKQVHSTVTVYNNDTDQQLPSAYSTHQTLDFSPNGNGYTVFGHGLLTQSNSISSEVHWQLTVMSSIANAFHVCDNDDCKELPLVPPTKLHVEEIFIPNQRNILGAIQISLLTQETVFFRASASFPELEMEAVLRTTSRDGQEEELARYTGKGELYWPYIKLDPWPIEVHAQSSSSMRHTASSLSSSRLKSKYGKGSSIKLKPSVKVEVIAPDGWPLTIQQWQRVEEIINSHDVKVAVTSRKSIREKVHVSSRVDLTSVRQPLPDDAYVELECCLSSNKGVSAKRDDTREVEFNLALLSWEAQDIGRNVQVMDFRKVTLQIIYRKEFRDEYLEVKTSLCADNTASSEISKDAVEPEEELKMVHLEIQKTTPEAEAEEMPEEVHEEIKYIDRPEELKDKFKELDFVALCTKEINVGDIVIMTTEMIDAWKENLAKSIEDAKEFARQMQVYNEINVLEKQKSRCKLIETLHVDSQWSPGLSEALDERNAVLSKEALNRTISATRKKSETKKKR